MAFPFWKWNGFVNPRAFALTVPRTHPFKSHLPLKWRTTISVASLSLYSWCSYCRFTVLALWLEWPPKWKSFGNSLSPTGTHLQYDSVPVSLSNRSYMSLGDSFLFHLEGWLWGRFVFLPRLETSTSPWQFLFRGLALVKVCWTFLASRHWQSRSVIPDFSGSLRSLRSRACPPDSVLLGHYSQLSQSLWFGAVPKCI